MSRQPRMTTLVTEYLQYRQQLGCELKTVRQMLMQFARYTEQIGHRGSITSELAVSWAALATTASGNHRAYRLTAVRNFARYRVLFDSDTEIPPTGVFGPAYRRKPPYIYSPAELTAVLKAACDLSPAGSLRPQTTSTLLGLLMCTGLRGSEARHLTRADVDFQNQLLHVRKTKFRKSRLVPLHESTIGALKSYEKLRDQRYPDARTDAFFVTLRGTTLSAPGLHSTFSQLRKQLTWRCQNGRRLPRLHDFRHTFACHRLLQWYEQGVDVNHAIAALATYLGHTDASHTYWYLTATPELLNLAGARFERHFSETDSGGNP